MKSKLKQIKAYIKALIISRFAPDYEEIKAENKDLKQDIHDLVRKGNEAEGIATKLRWEIAFSEDDMMLSGDGVGGIQGIKGVFSSISEPEPSNEDIKYAVIRQLENIGYNIGYTFRCQDEEGGLKAIDIEFVNSETGQSFPEIKIIKRYS